MKNPNCPTDEEIAEQNERKEKIRLVNLALLKASNPHRTYYASVRMEPIHVCIGSGHINSDELDTDE